MNLFIRLSRWLSGLRICLQCRRPGLGRSPGGGHGNPLQYSCLENPIDKGAWQPEVHGITSNQTQLKRLSIHTCTNLFIKKNRLTDIESKLKVTNVFPLFGGWGRDKLGFTDTDYPTYKRDNQQGLTVEHRKLYSISYDKP